MAARETQKPAGEPLESLQSVWDQVRAALEGARHRIYEEIRSYPRPVAGCDQQFNFLLEQRSLLAEECAQAEAACAQSVGRDLIEPLVEFLGSSRGLDEATKERIRSALTKIADPPP